MRSAPSVQRDAVHHTQCYRIRATEVQGSYHMRLLQDTVGDRTWHQHWNRVRRASRAWVSTRALRLLSCDRICVSCAPGRFKSAVSNARHARRCWPPSALSGQADCVDCVAGKYQDQKGLSRVLIAYGQYQAQSKKACIDCAAHFYQDKTGQSSCSACNYQCKAGFAHQGCGLPNPGKCVACGAGQFKETAGTTQCSNCPSGKFTDAVGQSVCKSCPGADAQTNRGGKYQDQDGQTGCKSCDHTCAAGEHKLNLAEHHTGCGGSSQGQCVKCDAGTKKAAQGAHSCKACAAGRFHEDKGQLDCKDCPSGKFIKSTGSSTCATCDYRCAAGKQHEGCGAASAGACKDARRANSRRMPCISACENCACGQYQSAAGKTACPVCSAHTFQDKRHARLQGMQLHVPGWQATHGLWRL